MKVYLGTDHAGFNLKEKVKIYLLHEGYDVVDLGAAVYDKDDDYPVFIGRAAESVSKDPGSRGIVFGGSGQGEAMVANKFAHVRCALFYAPHVALSEIGISGKTSSDPFEMLRLTREHNDSNMLSLSARFLKSTDAIKAVKIFLESPFSPEARHKRRINMIEEIVKS
jgi:ribose 5-phosphate isomerase B